MVLSFIGLLFLVFAISFKYGLIAGIGAFGAGLMFINIAKVIVELIYRIANK